MEELAPDGNGEGSASFVRSGSPEWEVVSASSSSDSSEESVIQGLSVLESALEPSGLLQDDYFAYESNVSDVPSTSMEIGESMDQGVSGAVQQIETGLPSDSDGAENPQTRTYPVAVLPDSNLMEPVEKEDEDVSRATFGTQSVAGTEAGERSPQGLSQEQEPSTLQFNSPSPSDSNTGRDDMQQSDLRLQQSHQEGGEPVVPDPEPLVSERDDTHDAMEPPNRRSSGGSNRRRRSLLCASWLRRQLAVWQAHLRKANTLWSLALAAAVMGLLILGRGWRRLQAQNRILRLQLQAKDKKITQLMFQLIQMKESFSKSKQIPVIRTKPSLQIPQDRM